MHAAPKGQLSLQAHIGNGPGTDWHVPFTHCPWIPQSHALVHWTFSARQTPYFFPEKEQLWPYGH